MRSITLKILLTRSSLKLHTKMLHSLIKAPTWFFDHNTVAKSTVYGHVCTTINGLACIRTMGAQKAVIEDFHRFQNFHTTIHYALIAVSRWFGFNIDCLTVLLITVVTFLNVASSQNQNTGTVGLSLFYAISLLSFLQWTIRQTTEFENLLVAVERILEYGALPAEVDDAKQQDPVVSLPYNWPSSGEIVFENLKLKYDKNADDYILKGLTFRAVGGEKIGIVGRTGAGKSSIINALFRLSTFEGSILIDGVNINSVNLQELRKRISVIPQDPTIFTGTLRQNLDPFQEYEDDEIWRALDQVELKTSFDNQLGLQLVVQEGGTNLSVGQRQLVCLARALLRKNKILVVDEATSNVDFHTDKLIQRTIRIQFSDCTVLTIAHRIDTLLDYSQIIVMDDGRIVEMAPPSVLLGDQKSAFGVLYRESGKYLEPK
uniref:Uncharacterized protein n=1 Tax=Romanomermis culicivorax TaxID=13658 RepID=A0A915J8J8_ROMCU